MDAVTALVAFTVAAALLTITPGLDTILVLRTAAVESGRAAFRAGLGISTGTIIWGAVAGLGLGALLSVSETAYLLLKIAGAVYLFYLGGRMVWEAMVSPRELNLQPQSVAPPRDGWFLKGLMTNLLNPKIGIFYVSFLPQFIPIGESVAVFSVLLATVHAGLGMMWFTGLIFATRPISLLLRRPKTMRILDGLTGGVLIAFGFRLAFDQRTV